MYLLTQVLDVPQFSNQDQQLWPGFIAELITLQGTIIDTVIFIESYVKLFTTFCIFIHMQGCKEFGVYIVELTSYVD